MLQFAHLLDRTMQIAGPFLIGLAVVLWTIAFAAAAIAVWRQGWRARRRPPALVVGPALGFMVILGGSIGATEFLSHAAIDEVHQRLNGPVTEIRVDGKPAADPERLLSALRQIKPHNYHSFPSDDRLPDSAPDTGRSLGVVAGSRFHCTERILGILSRLRSGQRHRNRRERRARLALAIPPLPAIVGGGVRARRGRPCASPRSTPS